jgi:hypothetical protein
MRRRTRRRALVAGAAIGHHEAKKAYSQQAPADYQEAPPPAAPADVAPAPAPQYAPPPADPADEIDHFAKLHESGAMTDEEFAAAKAKVLGT